MLTEGSVIICFLYHYMPTVNKIAVHKKLNKNVKKNAFQLKIYSNSRPI